MTDRQHPRIRRPRTLLALVLAATAWGAAFGLGGCRKEPVPAPASEASPFARTRTLLSTPWSFREAAPDLPAAPPAEDADWSRPDAHGSPVAVPHTWGKEPRRAWYRTRLPLTAEDLGGRVYVQFEGVSVYANVYLNGRRLGEHRGAFTRFTFDVTAAARPGDNVLSVLADNDRTRTADSLPTTTGKQLYHLYGGLYRKAWLLKTAGVHVDPTDHAASGVYLTPAVHEGKGVLSVRTLVRNATSAEADVEVRHHVAGPDGARVATASTRASVPPGQRADVQAQASVEAPKLWAPGSPHLYTVTTEIVQGGRVVDTLQERTGFRTFHFDGQRFTLNGAPILVRGIGKHQETEEHASAVTDEELREDFQGLRDLGVNLVRLAHYPHAPLEYDLADEQGLLVWAENGHSNTGKIDETGDLITREMIRQNYNHPSIVIWSVGNETGYVRVGRFSAVAKAEDPTRLIAYATNIGAKGKKRFPNLDLIAHNTYRGWYRGLPWEFEEKALQMKFIAESGAGAVVSAHTDYAAATHVVDEFEPEEYRQLLGEIHMQVVFRDHPQEVPFYAIWIYRDFAIDKYKGRNTKGLVTYAGLRKDPYHLYRAFLRPETPLVHITSKTRFFRQGARDNGIKVYGNVPSLSLTVNGQAMGARANGEYHHRNGRRIDNVFFWPAPLKDGRNEILVSDGAGHEDRAIVYYARGAGLEDDALVRDLRSSNPRSPAWFVKEAAQDQWPFHWEQDGTADNTFDVVPEAARGAGFITTRRLSKPEARTGLSFAVTRKATVLVMASESPATDRALRAAGWSADPDAVRWRDNALTLVPARLYRKPASPGARLSVPALTADYLVLVKEASPAP